MDNQLIRIKDTVMARIDPGRDVPEDEIRQIIDNVLRVIPVNICFRPRRS